MRFINDLRETKNSKYFKDEFRLSLAIHMINHIQYDPDLESKKWVSYFDLLGIKQLSEDENTIPTFITISKAITECKKRVSNWDNSVEYAWFSDTFIFYTKDDSIVSFSIIENISRWFSYFLIMENIPVRGAISCDKLYADKNNTLFFGKALIEAYEYGEAQDWIFFLLCPSAVVKLEHLGFPAEKRLHYTYADIPYKKRSEKLNNKLPVCKIGNWHAINFNNQNPIIEKLKEMKAQLVSKGIDKAIIDKYDRTINFLIENKRLPEHTLNSQNDCCRSNICRKSKEAQ